LKLLEANAATHFLQKHLGPGGTDRQVHGAPGAQKCFQQPHAVRRAAGARHRQNQIIGGHGIRYWLAATRGLRSGARQSVDALRSEDCASRLTTDSASRLTTDSASRLTGVSIIVSGLCKNLPVTLSSV